MVNKHLSAAGDIATCDDEYVVEFDGQMLKIAPPARTVGVPATGAAAWASRYRGRVAEFAGLPKRLMADPVKIVVWAGQFEFEQARVGPIAAIVSDRPERECG